VPHIIGIPRKCPKEVALELEAAFGLFWAAPTACAGRIRVALELLMDHFRIPKKAKGNSGRYYELKLHARIERFKAKDPVVGAQLMALKWLGNSGSHTGAVKHDDLLDAFEILEHSLGELIDKKSKTVAKLAKKLAKKHGGK
jgi:hypothetical protein